LVELTGGEPLLQADALEPLLAALYSRGTEIEIETNGTFDFTRFQRYASICMDVKCPSSGEKSELALLEKIRPQDCVKFVVNDGADCRYAEEIMNTHHISGETFFSPVHGTDYAQIIRFILAGNLPVRLQLQLHKIIGVK
jgi:7-carboxy-7-deazaguanine synthase